MGFEFEDQPEFGQAVFCECGTLLDDGEWQCGACADE